MNKMTDEIICTNVKNIKITINKSAKYDVKMPYGESGEFTKSEYYFTITTFFHHIRKLTLKLFYCKY